MSSLLTFARPSSATLREVSGGRERELSSETPEDRDGDLFSGERNLSNLSDRGDRCGDQCPFEVGERCDKPAGPALCPTGDFNGDGERGDKGSDEDEDGEDERV